MEKDPLDGEEIFMVPLIGECVTEIRAGLSWLISLREINYIGRNLSRMEDQKTGTFYLRQIINSTEGTKS